MAYDSGAGRGLNPSGNVTTMGNGGRGKPISDSTRSVTYVASGTNSNQLLSISKTASDSAVKDGDPKSVVLQNTGRVPVIAMLGYEGYSDESTDVAVHYLHVLINPGESLTPPMIGVIPTANQLYALDGTVVDFSDPDANEYTDSTADTDDTTATDNVDNSATQTTVYLEPYTSATNCTANLFRVGDLIRIRDEIMEVTAIGDKSDLANNTLTVKRGLYGSTATSNTDDDDAVRFPFFNAYHDFDRYSTAQTDSNGRFKCFNMFGAGRLATDAPQGIVPGSFCLKYYEQGYQNLTNSGDITPATHSGLTAGETLKLDITVDGGALFQDLTFTLDSSNLNFGGTNGVISKIQDALDVQYYTAGHLYEKKVTVSIVNGNIRFTSGSHLSTSAILLADTTDSNTLIDAAANGRIPASGSIPSAVAARLPDDVIYDPITYATSPNIGAFCYDDGRGRIVGNCNGRINYETGAFTIVNAPKNANFQYSVIHSSPFGGKRDSGEDGRANQLVAVHANVLNKKMDGQLNVKVF